MGGMSMGRCQETKWVKAKRAMGGIDFLNALLASMSWGGLHLSTCKQGWVASWALYPKIYA